METKVKKPKLTSEDKIHEIQEDSLEDVGYESAHPNLGMLYNLVVALASNPSMIDASKPVRHNVAVVFEVANEIIAKYTEVSK